MDEHGLQLQSWYEPESFPPPNHVLQTPSGHGVEFPHGRALDGLPCFILGD